MSGGSGGGGYCDCACRDCFDIAISDKGEAALCGDCAAAGCYEYNPDAEGSTFEHCFECQRDDAYGVGEGDEDEESEEEGR